MKKQNTLILTAVILILGSCEARREAARTYRENTSIGYFDASVYDNIDLEESNVGRISSYMAPPEDKNKIKRSAPSKSTDSTRLIQYNAQLNLTVKTPDSAVSRCKAIAEKYEGYAQTLSSNKAVIRIKAEKLNEAINEISSLGDVTYKNVYADDVTVQYYDYKIRLENMERARKRYLELLDKAANVQETLLVEKELERLNGEIDAMKGRLSQMQHLVAYSTVTIYIHEKVKPGVLGYPFVWLYKGVKWLFVRN